VCTDTGTLNFCTTIIAECYRQVRHVLHRTETTRAIFPKNKSIWISPSIWWLPSWCHIYGGKKI